MSVLVRVFGAKPESDEYQCALVLKKKFEEYFSPDVVGEIFIQAKTVGLIQTAIRLVDEQNLRVIILTYNKALVSDIRRLFALAELPDMFQEQCVSINTMHSFFYQIISKGIYDGNLDGEAFIKDYQKYLVELLDFLNSDDDSITVITIRDIFNKKHDEINIVTQYILKIKQKQHFNNNLILSVF